MRQSSWLLAVLLVCAASVGQVADSSELSEVAARAGIILRGRVLGVATEPTRAPGELGVSTVTVYVDDGIRGAATGETIVIRQWNVAPDEYRVGESLVLFLYAPSGELGLTSPVGGRAGHRRADQISPQELAAFRTTVVQSPDDDSPRPRPVPKRPKKLPRRIARPTQAPEVHP